MKKEKILIITGSKSDLEIVSETEKFLKKFDIPFKTEISSAHRNPTKTRKLASEAEKKGIKVIICIAGMAAHLPGVVASWTNLPVLGVPIPNSAFKGVDSFLSMLQMPKGVPVATLAVGKSGAQNAAILACQILALSNRKLKKRMEKFKKQLNRS